MADKVKVEEPPPVGSPPGGANEQISAVLRDFGQGIMRLERRRMEMQWEIDRGWKETEARHNRMLLDAQRHLHEALAAAPPPAKKARREHGGGANTGGQRPTVWVKKCASMSHSFFPMVITPMGNLPGRWAGSDLSWAQGSVLLSAHLVRLHDLHQPFLAHSCGPRAASLPRAPPPPSLSLSLSIAITSPLASSMSQMASAAPRLRLR
uniref:Uncharacterized protein n=1 Tax=Oryza punctata TaxID=4537 RepID=A0A0E0LW44_ORYPU